MKARAAKPRALAAVAAALMAAPALAQQAGDWQVSGTNTLRSEYYRIVGDPNAGPYRFDGGQYYDEINLNFFRRLGAYDVVRGQLYGVANDSIYRATDHGFVPERINFAREKGDGPIPYRAEVGDLFASFSYRTLQRSLKGAQVELQPLPSDSGTRQSFVIVSGASQPSWRHLQGRDDWVTGASWLLETSSLARFSLNALHTYRQGDAASGTAAREQALASVTGDYAWQWSGNRLRAEGEIAALRGDHDGSPDATGAVDPASGRDRKGFGAFGQVSGANAASPFDYRLRFERYDRDYRPAEAVIVPDRRSEEAFAGWRFADGLALRGRAQQFVDGLQSGNELKTHTVGAALGGPFGASGMAGNVDAFWQELTRRDASVDRETWNLNGSLAAPLGGMWSGSATLSLQALRDRVAGADNVRTMQLQLGASRALAFDGWVGVVTPAVTLRRVMGGPSELREVYPGASIALARSGHALSASYGYQHLRPDASSVATVDVNLFRADYRYTTGPHTFGIEGSAYDRRVTVGQYNDTYRFSVYWTFAFDNAPRGAMRIVAAPVVDSGGALPRGLALLLAIAPGSGLDAARGRLESSGYGAVAQGGLRVYEARIIDDLDNRQRLVLEGDGGRVAGIGIVVDVADANDAAAVGQAYERARKAMLDRFGAPAQTFDQGAIGPTFAADLNAGRVVRAMQWRTADGLVRLGIPRRMDGQVRIEIQHAAAFGSPRDGAWGFTTLR